MPILPTYKKRAIPYLSGEKPTFATVLLSILMKVYGPDVLNWDGATIQMEVKEGFNVDMPRRVYDKLMGLLTALNTNLVYNDVEVFDHLVDALNGRSLGSDRSLPAVLDIAWAVTEIEMADPEPIGTDPKKRWCHEICNFIRIALTDEGMSMAPKTLGMVKSLPPTTRETEDPAIFAASWMGKQSAADEIDLQVEELTNILIAHLLDIGVKVPMQKEAQSLPDGTKVKLVDGNKIRNEENVGFIGGTNSEADKDVPKDEIWLEKDLKPEDRQKILVHEVVERALMREKGQSYNKAHATANKVEAKARGNTKSAEWTTPANKETHEIKHSNEFGGPEAYTAAEQEHSTKPAGDETVKDVRCKMDGDSPSCTMSYFSPSRGTLHVKRMSDGKTVTLFKVTP